MSSPIFFDHQAGSPLPAPVWAAMEPFLNDSANPASLHRGGVRARQALAEARERVARLIGATPGEIVFTSGGTESVNLALFGHARANRRSGKRGTHLVVAATEHAAVLRSAERLTEEGFTFSTVPVDGMGRITLEAVAAVVRPETSLVAIHWANHEVGTIAPVAELAAWCRQREIAFFSDASAAAGTVAIDLATVPVSLLALSPHRFGGPKGAGVLYVRRGMALEPLLYGGGQEEGRRAGTENLAAIVGAGVAAELLATERGERVERMGRVQRLLWQRIGEQVEAVSLHGPELGPGLERTVDNLNFSAAGIEGEAQALLCDLRGLMVSSGAACVSRDLRISQVLRAMGVSPDLALSNLVATLGPENTEEEAERAAGIYAGVVRKLRAVTPGAR